MLQNLMYKIKRTEKKTTKKKEEIFEKDIRYNAKKRK